MFTRFKALASFLIFAIVFTILVVVWGEDGLVARHSLEAEGSRMEENLLRKEGEVARLRTKEGTVEASEEYGRDLVHVFQDASIYTPLVEEKAVAREYRGLKVSVAFFIALIPALACFLVCSVFQTKKKRSGKERKVFGYDGYDD